MKIQRLHAQNFRNLTNLDLNFDQDFIILVGPNGIGKTSVLESVYYGSLLQAFPGGKSWELIQFDQDHFRIELAADGTALEFYYGRKSEKNYVRSQSVDGVKKKAGDVIGIIPTVTFLPADLNLLALSPGVRRTYLDDTLLQLEPRYEETLTSYAKTLSQRNELLGRIRQGDADELELDAWDDKLIEFAAPILSAREQLVDQFNSDFENRYEQVTGSSRDLKFMYIAPYQVNDDPVEEILARRRRDDIASATTSVGPHRDDWRIEDSEGRNLARFLSRGEQRSVILCLKLKEFDLLQETKGTPPILLLDELLAELDSTRRKEMVSHIPPDTQIFLTTTSLDEVPEHIHKQAQIIKLG